LAKNHTHTGIPVLRKSFVGSATMHDTRSFSTMLGADLALAAGVRRHRTVRHDDTGPCRRARQVG
jgi:hypothetical protein